MGFFNKRSAQFMNKKIMTAVLFSIFFLASCSDNAQSNQDETSDSVDTASVDVTNNEQEKVSEEQQVVIDKVSYKLPKKPLDNYQDDQDEILNTLQIMYSSQVTPDQTSEQKASRYKEYQEADMFGKKNLVEDLATKADIEDEELKNNGYRFKVPIQKYNEYNKSSNPNVFVDPYLFALEDYDFDKKGFLIRFCSADYPANFELSGKIVYDLSKNISYGEMVYPDETVIEEGKFGKNCYLTVENEKLASAIDAKKSYGGMARGYVYLDAIYRKDEPKLLIQFVQADINYVSSTSLGGEMPRELMENSENGTIKSKEFYWSR